MDIYVRGIQNHMIKPSDNGGLESVVDSVKHKVLISDTSLRLFIPPQVWKMTPILHQICGGGIYIIPKDIHIYLNRLRTRLVTYLQHNSSGRLTWNSLFSTISSSS